MIDVNEYLLGADPKALEHRARTTTKNTLREQERECDECGRVTDAGEYPDWINGVCEDCDPSILDHPENLERIGLREYHVILHVSVYAEDEDHAHEQASLMFDDNAVVTTPAKCDHVLSYYKGADA